jgi:hypothetical protein
VLVRNRVQSPNAAISQRVVFICGLRWIAKRQSNSFLLRKEEPGNFAGPRIDEKKRGKKVPCHFFKQDDEDR